MKLDVAGFDDKMKEEQELSQAAHKAKMSGGSGKEMVLEAEQVRTHGKQRLLCVCFMPSFSPTRS
jgi:hypothetical protein